MLPDISKYNFHHTLRVIPRDKLLCDVLQEVNFIDNGMRGGGDG